MLDNRRYFETLHSGYGQYFDIDTILFEQKTEQWHLIIFENATFGRVMALDGIIQTTERDEFIYHEMLTHVPLLAHGQAKRVLIIGGGDGGMLREVVKHTSLESITMVEIDNAVVEMCKTYLPNHSNGAYDDPRVNLVIDDGARFVNTTDERFDVIISDCTDPVGPGEVLFRSEFYQGCQRCLKPGGVIVAQNGVAFMQPDEVTTTYQRLGHYVEHCTFYAAAIPTYIGGVMTFAWGSDNKTLHQLSIDVITERFNRANLATRYYTPAIHQASFALPRYLVDALATV
ncbi:polyamine aminopropyltransferase [Celerinatantimonas yamalensis]|uniref:Polyamine aminopropyltransferase n=1 Tax=Celerinatantimonas yamalensis TaxID=559956 RepID=A0ABW9G717_9GAMM